MTPSEIKSIRALLGYQQGRRRAISTRALGKLIGYSGRSVENWEQGRYPIPKPAARLLAIILSNAGGPRQIR